MPRSGKRPTPDRPIDLGERLSPFNEKWAPKRIATVNDYDVRIAKVEGEFVWHSHPDTDEFFLVVAGHLTIRLRQPDQAGEEHEVSLTGGQIFVVPRGVQHCPVAADEASILMFEPTNTPNTGDAGGDRTRSADELA